MSLSLDYLGMIFPKTEAVFFDAAHRHLDDSISALADDSLLGYDVVGVLVDRLSNLETMAGAIGSATIAPLSVRGLPFADYYVKHSLLSGKERPADGTAPGSTDRRSLPQKLARISHRWSTASPQTSVLAAVRSVGLLDVLHEYDCGGSPRVVSGGKPCQEAPCAASLRQAMRNVG